MQKRRTKNNHNNKRNNPSKINKEIFFTAIILLFLTGVCIQI
jgi:hypothetical protein